MLEAGKYTEGRVFVIVKDDSFGQGVLNLKVGDKWEVVERNESTSHLPTTYKLVSVKDPAQEMYIGQRDLDDYFTLVIDIEATKYVETILRDKNISVTLRP